MTPTHESALPDSPDFTVIAERLRNGTIVPFFGAGASISCGLPSGRQLAEQLALRSSYPDATGREDLAHVASYLVACHDSLSLREEIRKAIGISARPGKLHQLLARTDLNNVRLFVTTNYDDLIEQALAARQPWVVVDRGTANTLLVRQHSGEWREVESKLLRETITDRERPVVLKLHGTFDREDRDNDSFLITEEHYVDFLGRPEGAQIPPMLAASLREKSFLFLGYGLRDWNVRVLLRKLALTRGRGDSIRSWAIVRHPREAERELWRRQHVLLHDIDLDDFVNGLEAAL
jgi:hypothetical protein